MTTRPIDIRDQPKLGLARTFELMLHGIRYRLFRSLVTVVVVAVAIAFMMNVVGEGLIKGALARRAARDIAELRQAAVWASRLAMAGTVEQTLRDLGASQPGDPMWEEIQAQGGLTADEMRRFHEQALIAVRWLDFVAGLDYARQRRLAHTAAGTELFDRLQTAEEQARYQRERDALRSLRWPLKEEEEQAFVRDWQQTKQWALRVCEGRSRAVAAVAAARGDQAVIERLGENNGEFVRAIVAAGFRMDPATAKVVAEQARRSVATRMIEESFSVAEMRRAVARRLNMLPAQVSSERLWRMLGDAASADWYAGLLRELKLPGANLTAADIVGLAEHKRRERQLERIWVMSAGMGGGFMGVGERMGWLVLVSLVVCVVGIANAMLMSVTERFREIATLKCLGALDGFIMLVFVLEACMLGVVGGFIGGAVGAVIAVGRMWSSLGWPALVATPWAALALAVAASVVVGVGLAALASLYPSWKAARLAPMEAMRIE